MLWILSALIFALATAIAILFPKSFGMVYILSSALASFLAWPALAVAGAFAISWFCTRKKPAAWVILIIKIGAIFAAGLLLYGLIGRHYYYQDSEATDRYVERAVPILDEIKAKTGKYPLRLPVNEVGLPEGFLEQDCYKSNGDVFLFQFHDPITLWNAFEFTSRDRRWMYYGNRGGPDRLKALIDSKE